MPAPTTTDDLLDLISKSGLLDPDRLGACAAVAQDMGLADSPKDLAHALVRAGLLTQFHAEQLLLGKYRGFTIGKFKVLERLGFGGMGIVYLAEHMMMRHRVAIKVLPTSKADNPAALGRFYREARAAGLLEHPNLVRAHDVDQEGNLHYLVMEYVDGASLHQLVSRSGPLDPRRAAHYLRQAAEGLEHARLAGLVHRDIKPANILVDRSGLVRILDLGLARFFQDETDPLTMKYDEKNVLGTADYVAPEQALNSHDVDTRADIYSLGCTFYFVLTGHPPFPTGKAAQKLIWHQVKMPTPIREVRPAVSEELAAILTRMLAKDPAKRFQTPGELAAALEPLTQEPIDPPRESELPRLSLAATRNTSSAEIEVQQAPPAPSPAGPRPLGKSWAVQVRESTQKSRTRPRTAAELGGPDTPHAADTNDHPSAAAVPARTRSSNTAVPTGPSMPMQALRLLAIVLVGIAMTIGVRWAAAQRSRPTVGAGGQAPTNPSLAEPHS